MLKRNLTAAILIVISLFFLLFLRTFYVELADILFFAFMIIGAVEMVRVGKQSGFSPMILPVIVFGVTIYPLFFFFGATGILLTLVISVLVALSCFLFKRDVLKTEDFLFTLLILIYPMLLCSVFFCVNHHEAGLWGILYILLVTLLSDAFALFAGALFGKKKLIEDVSPKKTVAGAIGAYVGGLLGATIILLLFDVFGIFKNFGNVGIIRLFDCYGYAIPITFVLAIICSSLAIIGDLVASLLKRKMKVKDFGFILPGHGGVMDRLDSLLFVAPVVWLFLTVYSGVMSI